MEIPRLSRGIARPTGAKSLRQPQRHGRKDRPAACRQLPKSRVFIDDKGKLKTKTAKKKEPTTHNQPPCPARVRRIPGKELLPVTFPSHRF